MRKVLSVSLSPQLIENIKKRTEKRGFGSVSNYIKYLVKADSDFMTEDEILKATKEADRDYKQGKLKKLKSLDELM